LRIEELHGLYPYLVIFQVDNSRRKRWAVNVACMGDERNAYGILVRKPEVEKPHERPRFIWEEDIKLCVKT